VRKEPFFLSLRKTSSYLVGVAILVHYKMSDFECIHKSFEGCGSIYIGPQPTPSSLDLLDSTLIAT
jgi:hypothetical protein